MVKWEFRLPFSDQRKLMGPLFRKQHLLFHLIAGESDQSLHPCKNVTEKVVSNGKMLLLETTLLYGLGLPVHNEDFQKYQVYYYYGVP
jgi:hypothetical protein